MLRKILASVFVLTVISALSQAQMSIYVRVKGAVQGVFHGGSTSRQHEHYSRCIGVDDLLVLPRDPATGFATGRAQHKPIKLTLDLDAAAPEFYNALLNNENLDEVSIEFWRTTATGTAELEYSIRLSNAALNSVQVVHPGQTATSTVLVVEMIYRKAVRTHAGGTSSTDIVGGG